MLEFSGERKGVTVGGKRLRSDFVGYLTVDGCSIEEDVVELVQASEVLNSCMTAAWLAEA